MILRSFLEWHQAWFVPSMLLWFFFMLPLVYLGLLISRLWLQCQWFRITDLYIQAHLVCHFSSSSISHAAVRLVRQPSVFSCRKFSSAALETVLGLSHRQITCCFSISRLTPEFFDFVRFELGWIISLIGFESTFGNTTAGRIRSQARSVRSPNLFVGSRSMWGVLCSAVQIPVLALRVLGATH